MKIHEDIYIEELVDELPDAVNYLAEHGIRCLRCGEPIWGTLKEAAEEKDFTEEDIQKFVKELQDMADTKES